MSTKTIWPGQELDRLIANKVMGLDLCRCTGTEIKQWQIEYMRMEDSQSSFNSGASEKPPRFGSDRTCNRCGVAYLSAHNYSTDISHAWEVIDKMNDSGWEAQLSLWGGNSDSHKKVGSGIKSWSVGFVYCRGGFFMGEHRYTGDKFCNYHNEKTIAVNYAGESAPHVICLAALQAMDEFKNEVSRCNT